MTYTQPGTRGILQAYPLSLNSRHVTGMSERERINFALEYVEMIYPGMRNHFEGGVTKCWDEDEWARGASAVATVRRWTFHASPSLSNMPLPVSGRRIRIEARDRR